MIGLSSKMVRWNAETAIDITGGRQAALEPRFVLSRRRAPSDRWVYPGSRRLLPAKLRKSATNAAGFSDRPLLSPTGQNHVTMSMVYSSHLP